MGTHRECLDNCLFVSIMSWLLIAGVLTIVYLFPLTSKVLIGGVLTFSICLHYVMGTHWRCLGTCLYVSIMSWVLIGVSCQWSICLYYVMGTNLECLDNCLFFSIMSWVLIVNVLTIVYFTSLCHGY